MRRLHTLTRPILVAAATAAASAAPAGAKALPTYHSPGYAPPKHLAVAKAPPPPGPLWLGAGLDPHVLVDEAGTAHVAWDATGSDEGAVMHYCRLERGGKACSSDYSTPLVAGSSDFSGPYPLAVGPELLLLDNRLSGTDTTTYLTTSDDGGTNFTGPDGQGGGVIGDQEPSGGAVIYGGANPAIGVISDTETGGTFFQGVPGGQFTTAKANLSTEGAVGDVDDGRLATDGDRPVASFGDDANVFVREWNGTGSVNDAGNWTKLELPGDVQSPRIAGGPSGLVLIDQTRVPGPVQVRRIAAGAGSATPPTTLVPNAVNDAAIAENPVSGVIAVVWYDDTGPAAYLKMRQSTDGGAHFGATTNIALLPSSVAVRSPGLSLAADGGGFVTFSDDGNRVGVVQFGPTTPTGKPGLGSLPGGSGAPDGGAGGTGGTGGTGGGGTSIACTKVTFGAVVARVASGCFLPDETHPNSNVGVSTGSVRVNGVDLVPDAGVRIVIDPHARTINSSGPVQVLLHSSLTDDTVLWHGKIAIQLPSAAAGATLFDFPMSAFQAELKGFPFHDNVQVVISGKGKASIPAHLELPATFLGLTGDGTLTASDPNGFDAGTLHFAIPDSDFLAFRLEGLHVDYTFNADTWTGGGALELRGAAAAKFKAEVSFAGGALVGAKLLFTTYPGVAIYPDVFLHDFNIDFHLVKPVSFGGGLSAGVFWGGGDSYLVDLVGHVHLEAGDSQHPTIVTVTGTGKVLELDLATAKLTYSTDGYADANVSVGFGDKSKWLSFSTTTDLAIYHHDFGATFTATGCALYICPSLQGAASRKGMAVCGHLGKTVGIDLPGYHISDIDAHWGCHMSAYQLQVPPGESGNDIAQTAAADRTFTVTGKQSLVDLELHGAGGAPSVTLETPGGAIVAPATPPTATSQLVAAPDPDPSHARTEIGLYHPQPGVWTVHTDPGSPEITSLSMAHEEQLPQVSAHVTGSGTTRALHYRLRGVAPDVVVQFVEQAKGGSHFLGTAKGSRGVLRFRPGGGDGGRRAVQAIVLMNGYNRAQPTVAHYVAPRLRRPGRVPGLRASRHGSGLSVSYRAAAGAVDYVVRVSATGGENTERITSGHRLTLRGLRRGARISISVVGENIRGVRGPTATQVIAAPSSKSPRKPKHTKHKAPLALPGE
jgi:hypothetical protein